MTRHILVADDEATIRDVLQSFLEGEGYSVSKARTGGEALKLLASAPKVDLLLLDLRMPDLSGMDVLQRISDQNIDVPVIIMTAFGTSNLAIKAIQLGAYDYITKPFELEDVLGTIQRFFEFQDLSAEVKVLRGQVGARDPAERIVGRSREMLDIYKTIGRVAKSDATVLITGETGTGKELIAEAIHLNSSRRTGSLVKVACASLTETLLESELFGHEKGSFTSAYAQRKGRFELADKGTIFLDEIGEMSLGTQKKLLRVLQEREFERVGGSTPMKVDTRVLAATNRNLMAEVEAGRFRADLYYRFNVITLRMPPLRDRKDDILPLAHHFLDKHRFAPGAPPAKLTEETLEALVSHDWPGNVRELENTIERAVVLAQGGVITPSHLRLSPSSVQKFIDVEQRVHHHVPLAQTLADVEKQMIVEALKQSGGHLATAAAGLGIDGSELQQKMTVHGIDN